MKLGIISTHTQTMGDAGPEWLPGAFRGGAELSDYEYLSAAPNGVEWEYTTPAMASTYDRVLVTSLDGMSDADLRAVAELAPVVFLHHEVMPSPMRTRFLEAARLVMLHTPAHEARTRVWCNPQRVELVLSAIDTSVIKPADQKQRFVLAASRNHPLKGLKNAKIWAAKHDYPCLVMTRQPREKVLEAMSIAEVFAHFPLEFESECRSVIEAVLSGCRIVTNANVGLTSVAGWDDPTQLRGLVDAAPEQYWRLVCE